MVVLWLLPSSPVRPRVRDMPCAAGSKAGREWWSQPHNTPCLPVPLSMFGRWGMHVCLSGIHQESRDGKGMVIVQLSVHCHAPLRERIGQNPPHAWHVQVEMRETEICWENANIFHIMELFEKWYNSEESMLCPGQRNGATNCFCLPA